MKRPAAKSVAFPTRLSLTAARRCASVSALALLAANCATDGQREQRRLSAQNQREIGAFADKRKYGSASPRVVADGDAVPKGGGRDHVGRPYRVAGRWYTPRENAGYSAVGGASWYGDAFHGRKTANGEVYDKNAYTAAHPTMPLPSYARVTNLSNSRSIIVRVNDRGPFHGGRIIDLSERVAHALEFKHIGTARVKVDYMRRANVAGSDDRMLVATLRTDGGAAQLPGSFSPVPGTTPIMVASNTSTPTTSANLPLVPHRTTVPIVRQQAPAQLALESDQESTEQAVPRQADRRDDLAPVLVAENRPLRRQMPLPQDRPFDLGSIPGAGTPMDRVNNGQAAAARQRVAAVYFAPVEGFQSAFGSEDPMRRLTPGAFDPRPPQPIAPARREGRAVR